MSNFVSKSALCFEIAIAHRHRRSNHFHADFISGKMKKVFAFSVISQKWHSKSKHYGSRKIRPNNSDVIRMMIHNHNANNIYSTKVIASDSGWIHVAL